MHKVHSGADCQVTNVNPQHRRLSALRRQYRGLVFFAIALMLGVHELQAAAVLKPSEAARFLTQATFGPTERTIYALAGQDGYGDWLREQFSAPMSLQLPYVQRRYYAEGRAQGRTEQDLNRFFNINSTTGARHDAWWRNVLRGEDQLRQRVAFALSEIFVVSDRDLALLVSQFGMADYYDTLVRHSFGNYRDLLEAITLHPVMGKYLSSVRNEPNDAANNKRPDENFARELLQLFSIGVNRIKMNGQPFLNANGSPIASYSQADIVEYARVFTGWNYQNLTWDYWDGLGNVVKPMVPVARYHEPGAKRLINGRRTDGSARVDLKAALDSIFLHPNVPPFISKQLIQRLITSNPTPAYIARVARVFVNNGQGVRGDLRATVRAILLDQEARNGHNLAPRRFGKLREPLLRITHSWRAFSARATPTAQYGLVPDMSFKTPFDGGMYELNRIINQGVLRAPSVFNFFLPNYSPPGILRTAGMVGPEFQIATESATLGITNLLNGHVQEDWAAGNVWTPLHLARQTALARNPERLLDHLNLVLLSGSMTSEFRKLLLEYLDESPLDDSEQGRLAMARDAISLIINSPDYLIQK